VLIKDDITYSFFTWLKNDDYRQVI